MCVVHWASEGELHTDSSELVTYVLCIGRAKVSYTPTVLSWLHVCCALSSTTAAGPCGASLPYIGYILYRYTYCIDTCTYSMDTCIIQTHILYRHMYYTDTHTV